MQQFLKARQIKFRFEVLVYYIKAILFSSDIKTSLSVSYIVIFQICSCIEASVISDKVFFHMYVLISCLSYQVVYLFFTNSYSHASHFSETFPEVALGFKKTTVLYVVWQT